MKRFFSFLVFLVLAHPAYAHKENAYERVMRTGELRCGYAMSPPNLEVDPNSGELTGLERDIWDEIGKELDLKILWTEEVGWGNYIEGLRTGRYDAFCNQAWPTPARLKKYNYGGPYDISNCLCLCAGG